MTQERLPDQAESHEAIPTSEYRLLDNPQEILQTWSRAIDQAQIGDPIIFRTMHLREGDTIKDLKDPLKNAAQRGLNPKIIFDPISYYLSDVDIPSYLRHVPLPVGQEVAHDYEKNRALLDELTESGITLENSRPKSLKRQVFPYIGADHIKGARIGDKFWMMSDNLEDTSFQKMHGFAVEINNPELAEELTTIISSTNSPDQDKEKRLTSDPRTIILQDAGIRASSIIYARALEMAKNETEFLGISFQFLPEANTPFSSLPVTSKLPFFSKGKIVQELERLKEKGVDVEALTSSQSWFKDSYMYYVMERINAKSLLSHKNRPGFIITPNGVHAKYVVTPDAVLFGTNNFAEAGINAGTAELAIYSTDPKLVSLVREYHNNLTQASLANMARKRAERLQLAQ